MGRHAAGILFLRSEGYPGAKDDPEVNTRTPNHYHTCKGELAMAEAMLNP
jgi:hypothetical protein